MDITPPVGSPLSDAPLGAVVTGAGRHSDRLRDKLYARALHLRQGEREATLVVGDLLVITDRLHAEVAERAGSSRERLLLAATHTHSGPGGYWKGGRLERLVGAFDPAMFERIADGLASAARQAAAQVAPATVRGSSVPVVGASANRRRLYGPVDPELTVVRFDVDGDDPIDLVSFGAHPVIGSERDNGAISADYPGELCRRLVSRGVRPLFVQGAVGGLSPLFPEFPMKLDEHLELMGDVLERGYDRAIDELAVRPTGGLATDTVVSPVGEVECTMFPEAGARWKLAETAVTPLRRWMKSLGEDGRESRESRLGLLRFSDVALVGTPSDLGVGVALEMKRVLRAAGVGLPIVASQCGGYVGYVHLPDDYDHVPEPGFREMAFYENAMSLSGRRLGRVWVDDLAARLGRRRS